MFKKFCLFALVAIGVGYIFSAYRATGKFVEVLNSKNPALIAQAVDWNAVEEIRVAGLRGPAREYIAQKYPQHLPGCEAWLDSAIRSAQVDVRGQLEGFMRRNPEVKIAGRTWNSPREIYVNFEGGYGAAFRFAGGKWVYIGTGSPGKNSPLAGPVELEIEARCGNDKLLRQLRAERDAGRPGN